MLFSPRGSEAGAVAMADMATLHSVSDEHHIAITLVHAFPPLLTFVNALPQTRAGNG